MIRRFLPALAAALTIGATCPANAQSGGGLATEGLAATIKRLSSDPAANRFELGMMQTLRAVEKTLQARYEFGLGQNIPALPLLRLGGSLTPNPWPKPAAPDTLSRIVDDFLTDMITARATLEAATPAPFDLTLQDIWFDVNLNGTRESSESAVAILGAFVLDPVEERMIPVSGH